MTTFLARIPSRIHGRYASLAVCLFLCAYLSGPAQACGVTVVLSAELKPYREVLQGLREATRCPVSEARLQDGDLPDRLSKTPPDVVVAIGTEAYRKLQKFHSAPLVHVMVIPLEVESAPAGAGVSMDIAPETWLRAIKRVFPKASRIGMLFSPGSTGAFVDAAQQVARDAGLDLVAREVKGADEVPQALNAMQHDIDLLWMLPDPAVAAPPMAEYLLRYSIQHRIPIMTFSKKYLEMGAVASLDVDLHEMGLQAGELVNKVVQGERPEGSRYARKPRLSVNSRAAEKMGVALSKASAGNWLNDD